LMPLDDFVRDGDYLNVTLSPSGKYLAARVRVDGDMTLVIVDRQTGQPAGGGRAVRNGEVHAISWISDERLLQHIANKAFGLNGSEPTGELRAIDADGGNNAFLGMHSRRYPVNVHSGWHRARADRQGYWNHLTSPGFSLLGLGMRSTGVLTVVDRLAHDDDHLLIATHPLTALRGRLVDTQRKLTTVQRLRVDLSRPYKLETLPFRNARPSVDRNGALHFVTYQSEAGLWAAAYRESESSEWRSMADVVGLDDESTVVGLNSAATAAYLRAPYGDDGFFTIYRFDREANSIEPVFTDLDADIENWVFDPQTGEIAAGTSLRGQPRYHYPALDTATSAVHKKLARAFDGKLIDIVSATDRGDELVVRVSSDVDPGQYYLFDSETGKADFFWGSQSWIDPRRMRPTLVDEVVTDDGLSLPVRLTLPDSAAPAPLIVYPHDDPHGGADVWEFDRLVQLLANRGYAVLQVNYRGSTSLGKAFREAGYGEWGGKMIDDIVAATRWAAKHRAVDGHNVCAYGIGYGAYAAYMIAVREPELLKCAAGYIGLYDLSRFYRKGEIKERWGGEAQLERWLGDDEALHEAYSPASRAGDIRARTLLVYRTGDFREGRRQTRAMRKALIKAGNEPVVLELDTEDRSPGRLHNQRVFLEALLTFLATSVDRPGQAVAAAPGQSAATTAQSPRR
ncbi:MAG: prolyl oligopeptidase family serine peptidase, partial [Pseudomonadota bacterium]